MHLRRLGRVHGVGGFLGIILLGVFASTLWNPGGADGLLRGNPSFLGKQLTAAIFCSAYAFVFTWVSLWLINFITRVKVATRSGSSKVSTSCCTVKKLSSSDFSTVRRDRSRRGLHPFRVLRGDAVWIPSLYR